MPYICLLIPDKKLLRKELFSSPLICRPGNGNMWGNVTCLRQCSYPAQAEMWTQGSLRVSVINLKPWIFPIVSNQRAKLLWASLTSVQAPEHFLIGKPGAWTVAMTIVSGTEWEVVCWIDTVLLLSDKGKNILELAWDNLKRCKRKFMSWINSVAKPRSF